MKKSIFLLFAIFFAFAATGQEYKGNIAKAERIKVDTAYYWGMSDKLDDYDDALENALNNLFRNIQNNYKSNAVLFPGDQQGQLLSIFKTFNDVVIQQATPMILMEGDENQCFAYLMKADFRKALNQRYKEVVYYVNLGNEAYDKDNLGDALRYYYIALMLCYSHPDGKSLEMNVDGKQVKLYKWLSNKIDGDEGIMNTLNFIVKDWSDEGDYYKAYLKVITQSGYSVTNLIIRYNSGGVMASTRVENGSALLVINKDTEDKTSQSMLNIDIDMNYSELERESPVAFQMTKNLRKKIKFNGASHNVQNPFFATGDKQDTKKKKEEVEKKDVLQKPIAKDKTDEDFNVKDPTPYLNVMSRIEAAIRNNNCNLVRDCFTDTGFEMFEKLMKYGKCMIINVPDYKFVRFRNEVICRYLPMQFQFNRMSFARDIVFRFDENTKLVNSLAFRLSDVAERDLVKATKSSMRSTLVIMTFLEDYQTSYALKQIDYLNMVFSDDALIIVGHVLDKKTVPDQMNLNLDGKSVSFIKRTKAEYIANLKENFKRLDYINIHFANLEVEKSSNRNEEIYGIQVKQYYYSNTYCDEGYLFLMVDLREDVPIIHVRAWQDIKTDINDLVTLRDVF
jgi:hypothetical protein